MIIDFGTGPDLFHLRATDKRSQKRTIDLGQVAMAPSDEQEEPYTPKNAINSGALMGSIGLGGGFFAAAMKNALQTRNVGAFAVFRNNGNFMLLSGMASINP